MVISKLVVVRSTERPDRKSTRLNSSHSSISYAVFCLKKKSVHMQDNKAFRADLLSTASRPPASCSPLWTDSSGGGPGDGEGMTLASHMAASYGGVYGA